MSILGDYPERAASGGEFPPKLIARFAERSQSDFEIEFFDRILQRDPSYVDVLRCQGELLTRQGMHERALEVDRRLAELLPHDCIVHYNLACSLALGEQQHEAIEELRMAIEQGYDDFGFMVMDADLQSLREHPDYRELLRDYGVDE